MKIQSGRVVTLELELRDEDGEAVYTLDEDGPLVYVHGGDDLPLAGLERALEDAEVGAEFSLELPPEDAFGEYDVECLVSVPRSQLPPDAEVVPGDVIPVELHDEGGDELGEIEMRVDSLSDDSVVLDANHPLAGKTLSCRAKVLEVRDATPEDFADEE